MKNNEDLCREMKCKIARAVRNCSNTCANLNRSIRGKPHLLVTAWEMHCGCGGMRSQGTKLQLARAKSRGKVAVLQGFCEWEVWSISSTFQKRMKPCNDWGWEKKLKKLSQGTLCKHSANHFLSVSSKSGCSELATWSALCFHFVYYCYLKKMKTTAYGATDSFPF